MRAFFCGSDADIFRFKIPQPLGALERMENVQVSSQNFPVAMASRGRAVGPCGSCHERRGRGAAAAWAMASGQADIDPLGGVRVDV